MGRKIDIKKIENVTKCQITFSKRRNGLIKKANEIAVCCEDVDVALLAFSPSGRISKYSNQRRIEDVLNRYVNLSTDKRLNHITNVQEKLEKLKQIDHIKGDNKKLHFLETQTENLELQIKKRGLELQILEAGLRDYVPGDELEPSLHQLLWCERNLQHSLERVMARKNALFGLSASDQQQIFQNVDLMDQMEIEDNGVPFANFNENVLTSAMQNPSSSQVLKELDPWISPYSAQARENMLQNLLDDGTRRPDRYNPRPSDTSNFHLAASSAFFESGTALNPQAQIPPAAYIPQQKRSSMADQSLLDFPDQNIDSWKSLFAVDLNHNLVKNPSNFMPTRFTSTTIINTSDAGKGVDQMPQSEYYQTETGFECAGSKSSNFTSMQEGADIGLVLPNMYSSINFSKGTSSNGNGNNIFLDENGTGNFNEGINKEDESQALFVVPPLEEVGQDELFGSFQTDQGIMEDNSFWSSSKIQKTGSWDWDELLWEENFSVTDFNNNI